MSNNIILLDVDETVTLTISEVLERYNKRTGKVLKRDNVKSYYLHENEGFEKSVLSIFKESDLYENLVVDQEARECVPLLQAIGYEVAFLTAIMPEGYWARHQWLKKNFPTVPEKNYIFTNRKDLVKGEWILDDCWDHLEKNQSNKRVCIEKPWNKSFHEDGISKIKSFGEFYQMVLNYKIKGVVS